MGCPGLLGGLGFSGDEARLRARMVYLYQVGEQVWAATDSDELRQRLYTLHVKLLEEASQRLEPGDG